MQIHDAKDEPGRLGRLVLDPDPLAEGAQIVPQVRDSGRLDAGEDADVRGGGSAGLQLASSVDGIEEFCGALHVEVVYRIGSTFC